MFLSKHSRAKKSRGQSLVETVLLVPLLLILILNAVNFGYFLLVTLNLTSATRNGIEYAIQGSSTPANGSLPQPTGTPSITSLINQELGNLHSGTLSVQTCTVGGSSNGSEPACSGVSGDPEASNGFALIRVTINYQFSTLIPTAPFNLVVGALPPCGTNGQCNFTRQATMRAMGS